MKLKFVFRDWIDDKTGDSIYHTPVGVELALGDLHSGTVFQGHMEIDDEVSVTIEKAAASGIRPVFSALLVERIR